MESLPAEAEERWPTDIVERRETAMLARFAEAEPELAPLRSGVAEATRAGCVPVLAQWIVILGGGWLTWNLWGEPVLGWVSLGLTIVLALAMGGWSAAADAATATEQEALDTYLRDHVLYAREAFLPEEGLAPFQEMGVFGRYDEADLRSFEAEGYPLMHVHLTRSETTRDSKGEEQTRTTTVFSGLCFELPFPVRGELAEGQGSVTIVERGLSAAPQGRFVRYGPGGQVRPKRIKTASLDFNRRHTVFTTDPVMGHAVLDPDRTMRLTQMEHDLADTQLWGRQAYAMAIAEGRMWMVMPDVDRPQTQGFEVGEGLADALKKSFYPLSVPSVVAHHLKLPLPAYMVEAEAS